MDDETWPSLTCFCIHCCRFRQGRWMREREAIYFRAQPWCTSFHSLLAKAHRSYLGLDFEGLELGTIRRSRNRYCPSLFGSFTRTRNQKENQIFQMMMILSRNVWFVLLCMSSTAHGGLRKRDPVLNSSPKRNVHLSISNLPVLLTKI